MSENKFPYTIASDMFFVTQFGASTIEFHLVELANTDPDNPEIIGYGIWAQQDETGTLLARFDTNVPRELCVAFMLMFNTAALDGLSEYAQSILDDMFNPDPNGIANNIIIPDTATVEALSK
jgi:hypothetical protein